MKHYAGLSDWPGKTLKANITSIICAGWKVLGQKKVNCINAWDFKTWRKDVNDDYALCKAISKVIQGADCIVTHNGVRFDWKHLDTRLLIHDLPRLPKVLHVDTCKIAKRHLYFTNNKLQTLGETLVKDKKLKHEGWEMWVKVGQRDSKAMKMMTRYCKKDVVLLEKVFLKLRKYSNQIPNHNNFVDPLGKSCPNCGNHNLIKWGYTISAQVMNARLLCKECGTWVKGAKLNTVSRPNKTL